VIGQDELGVVYKAKHQMMNHLVALKILRPDLVSDTESVERFRQELKQTVASAAARGIVIHDSGVSLQNEPYLVMDYVPGRGSQSVDELNAATGSLAAAEARALKRKKLARAWPVVALVVVMLVLICAAGAYKYADSPAGRVLLAELSLDALALTGKRNDDPQLLSARERLALAYAQDNRLKDAGAVYLQIKPQLIDKYGPESKEVMNAQACVIAMYRLEGNNQEAKRLYGELKSSVDNEVGMTVDDSESSEKAVRLYEPFVMATSVAMGADSREAGSALVQLGSIYQANGRYPQAVETLLRALPINEREYGPNSMEVGKIFLGLGRAAAARNAGLEACSNFERAIQILKAHNPQARSDLQTAESELACVYWSTGKLEKAEPLVDDAVALGKSTLYGYPSRLYELLMNAGDFYMDISKPARAEPLLQEALEVAQSRWYRGSAEVQHAALSLARCYSSLHKYNQAEKLLESYLSMAGYAALQLKYEVLRALGNTYMEDHNYRKAEAALRLAVSLSKRLFASNPQEQAGVVEDLNKCLTLEGKPST